MQSLVRYHIFRLHTWFPSKNTTRTSKKHTHGFIKICTYTRPSPIKKTIIYSSFQCTTKASTSTPGCLPPTPIKQLDDEWPESVEEQGLLLLVWRHHITKQYPPTPADARGSALGNNTFDSCFGLQN